MKKHLALVLALVMILSSFSFVSAAPDFSDVKGTVSEDAVNRLELLDVLKGYPDGTFKPEGSITRAEFATVAVRILGLEGAAKSAQGNITAFSDVPAWHWASGYVGIAANAGIVNGIGNGLFAPEAPVKYEEAVTMLVRALGYEPEAQAKGGYPYGYLIVAEDIDLLDGLRGSLGTFATRGLVAQLTDNALEIPMMVSIGFGDNIRWVVSGTERNVDEQFLIERMGYDPVEGRVTSFSTSRKTVTLTGEDSGTYDVMDSFDYLETEGVLIKAWVNKDDLVVAYNLKEDVYFDAVEFDEKDDIELITLDDTFEVARSAKLELNGNKIDVEDFNADFAKVVIDEDGYVIWAKAYDFDNFIVVEEVEKDTIYAYDDYDEEDLKDFDIMKVAKAGKTIEVEDIEEGDVVFVNRGEEFAVVYNESLAGVVDRAYNNKSFRMDGKTYDLAKGKNDNLVPVFLEDGEMDVIEIKNLEEFVDEGEEIDVFFDFYGDVVLMSGDKGTAKTSTYGLLLEEEPNFYPDARTGKWYLALDGVNEEGANVSFDAKESVIKDSVDAEGDNFVIEPDSSTTTDKKVIRPSMDDSQWEVIEYTVDEDGDLEDFALLVNSEEENKAFKITDRYANGFRLKSGTVFFLLEDDGPEEYKFDEVFKLADADKYFEEVKDSKVFSANGVDADYIVVYDSDAIADNEEVGVLSRIRELAKKDEFELTINIEGKDYTFVVDKKDMADGLKKGDVITFLIDEDMKEVRDVKASVEGREDLIGKIATGKFTVKNSRDKTFTLDTVDGKTFELDKAVVLDATNKATSVAKTVNFSDFKDGDTVNVYYEGSRDTVFVKYLVEIKGDPVDPVDPATGWELDYTPDIGVGNDESSIVVTPATGVTDLEDKYVVIIEGFDPVVVKGYDVNPTIWMAAFVDEADDSLFGHNKLYTAKLYAVADLDTALATLNFIAKVDI